MTQGFQTKILILKERFLEVKRKGKIAGDDGELSF